MFERLEIKVLPPGPRLAAEVRFLVDGEDVVAGATGPGGFGAYAGRLFPPHAPSPLAATGPPRRVELGEPECTGGCCGHLSAVVQRIGGVVRWSDWEVPQLRYGTRGRFPEFDFEAEPYDAELARAAADPWWRYRG
ncbi:hypothetical protein ACWD4P_12075 [Kitasatospora sp. NPDC002543]